MCVTTEGQQIPRTLVAMLTAFNVFNIAIQALLTDAEQVAGEVSINWGSRMCRMVFSRGELLASVYSSALYLL